MTKTDKFYKYVTLRFFDRFSDRIERRIDGIVEKYRKVKQEIEQVRAFLEIGPHASAWQLFLQTEE